MPLSLAILHFLASLEIDYTSNDLGKIDKRFNGHLVGFSRAQHVKTTSIGHA